MPEVHADTEVVNTAAFMTTPRIPSATRQEHRSTPPVRMYGISVLCAIYPCGSIQTFTFRADAHNAFNHPQFSGLGTSTTNTKTFGTVTGAQDPRMLLLVGHLRF